MNEVLREITERTMPEAKEKIAQNIVDYYFKQNLPLIPPPKLVFKERSISQEEKQMTLDEIMKRVTPEGMYVYLERCDDQPGYRFHVHTGEKWKTGILDYGAIVKGRWGEARSVIYAATMCERISFGDDEFPRRCDAQREAFRSILGKLIVEDGYLKEFSKRMGVNPEAYTWEINPSGQIKSVQVLQDIVSEEIEKLKTPEASRGAVKLEDSPQELIDRDITSQANSFLAYQALKETEAYQKAVDNIKGMPLTVKCECGSGKLGIPHSLWCPAK